MILIPKGKGYLHILPKTRQPFDEVEFTLNRSFVGDKKFEISFNKGKYYKFYDGMKIPEELKDSHNLIIRIREVEKKKYGKIYESDKLSVTNAILVGCKEQDEFANAFTHLNHEIEDMRKLMKKLEERLIDLTEIGDIV